MRAHVIQSVFLVAAAVFYVSRLVALYVYEIIIRKIIPFELAGRLGGVQLGHLHAKHVLLAFFSYYSQYFHNICIKSKGAEAPVNRLKFYHLFGIVNLEIDIRIVDV